MRTDLPIVLALAAKANAFFRGSTARLEVLAGHPAFARVHDLTFVRQTGLGGEMVADASLPWFRRLKNEGVNRIRPTLTGMRMDRSADAPWGLLSEGDRGLELWTTGVGRRFEGHDDLQPLRLTLTSGRFDRWSMKPPFSVEDASANLGEALRAAQAHLEQEGQTIAGNAVGKYLALHEAESPELSGSLECIVPDLNVCAVPLFASASRCLSLLVTTGWLSSKEDSARVFAEPLWSATRIALESTV